MHIASFLLENITEGLVFQGNSLIEFDKSKILEQISQETNYEEYNEILKRL